MTIPTTTTTTEISLRTKLRSLGLSFYFDALTAALSAADVVADVLVALQFYNDGHTAWAYAVAASLMISSLCYAFFFANMMLPRDPVLRHYAGIGRGAPYHHWSMKKQLATYALSFVFSQLLPSVMWCVTTLHCNDLYFTWIPKGRPSQSDTCEGWDALTSTKECAQAPPPPPTPRDAASSTESMRTTTVNTTKCSGTRAVVEEELEYSRRSAPMMRRVHAAMKDHVRTHLLFYIETATEAIPQALIQLLAMTYTVTSGEGPSTLQLFSLGMSLLTICTKAYVLSVTFDIYALVFKTALVVHDLFALFYVYSTVLSPRAEGSWSFDPVGLGVDLGVVSAVWLLRLLTLAVLFAVIVSLIAFQVAASRQFRVTATQVVTFLCFAGVIVVGFVPATIAVDGLKVAWLCLFDSSLLPSRDHFPAFSALLSFVWKGNDAGEVQDRLMHVAYAFASQNRNFFADARSRMDAAKTAASYADTTMKIRSAEARMAIASGPHMRSTAAWRVLLTNEKNPTGSLCCLWTDVDRSGNSASDYFLQRLMLCFVVFYGVTQFLLLSFPLANIFVEGAAQQNPLQVFTACVSTLCLVIAAFMSPQVWTYFKLVACARVKPYQPNVDHVGDALDVIRSYIIPSPTAVVTAATPHAVVSRAVSELVVGPYLSSEAMTMDGLSSDECRWWRRAFNARDS